MKILIAIVHHWNPKGNGRHQSLRQDPLPKLYALQDQLLALRRLGSNQGVLDIGRKMVTPANESIRHDIDIHLITAGVNTVVSRMEPIYKSMVIEAKKRPMSSMHLGFEAQKHLSEYVDAGYDLMGYMEDDLIIHDQYFFHKINWFIEQLGEDSLVLPHRMELWRRPDRVDKFYIDGPVPEQDIRNIIPEPAQTVCANLPVGKVLFESPKNPHSGCFFLRSNQLRKWMTNDNWQDNDCTYVSPLESAATLGISKNFKLYKPAYCNAGWLELQHWGNSFRSLIGNLITLEEKAVG